MTAWIEKKNNEYTDDYTFCAYLGFRNSGYTVQPFHDPRKIHYKKGDIVVGCIQSIQYMAKKLNITLPNFYIPDGCQQFAGRTVSKSTIGDVVRNFKMDGVVKFIKPVNIKEFPAQVLDPKFPLMTFIGQDLQDTMECWVSDVVNFISEYRVFIVRGKIIGCKYYWGDFRVSLDWKVVDSAVNSVKIHPRGWCLDFGVTDKGETLLIEANDGYSIGNYGLDAMDYALLLKERFLELAGN